MNSKNLNNAIDYLKKDKNLKKLIDKYDKPKFGENSDYFNALSKSIIYQQISGKAANSIHERFLLLFKNLSPNPKLVLNLEDHELKSIGLSQQKTNYIKNVAEYFYNQNSDFDLGSLSDQDITSELIQIKGIGQWTIDMFLMFTLFRTDIMPVSDLGIKKGFKHLFNLKTLPDANYMIQKSKNWKPYRTIACLYLWKLVDGDDFIY